jgi:hypothetical protein
MPAKPIQSAPKQAPEFVTHRYLENANDPADVATKGSGIVMQGNRFALIGVHPEGGAAPAISVHFWSEEVDKFVAQHTPLDFAAKAVNAGWQTVVECLGRIMLVKVTAGNTGVGFKTTIRVAGFDGQTR